MATNCGVSFHHNTDNLDTNYSVFFHHNKTSWVPMMFCKTSRVTFPHATPVWWTAAECVSPHAFKRHNKHAEMMVLFWVHTYISSNRVGYRIVSKVANRYSCSILNQFAPSLIENLTLKKLNVQ